MTTLLNDDQEKNKIAKIKLKLDDLRKKKRIFEKQLED